MEKTKKPHKKKGTNYFYSIFSIALVLFVIGVLAISVYEAKVLTSGLKENIQLHLELKENVTDVDVMQLTKRLQSEPFVKKASFTSKEQAAKDMQEQLGDNFIDLLGFNPLYSSIDVNINSKYAINDSLLLIKADLLALPEVKDVSYPEYIVTAVESNIKKFSLILIVVGILLLVIAISLIDSTIRLAMFSNRFLIRSMQLVGATKWFITKPFLSKSVANGLFSGILAAIGLIATLYFVKQQFPELVLLKDLVNFAIVIGLLIISGIVLSAISTHFAINKYLGMKLDDLY